MNSGFFLNPASSQGHLAFMYPKYHHIWRNGKLPDTAVDVLLTRLCWETSRLIHSPLSPGHVFVTTANLFQTTSSGCPILDTLSQGAWKGLGDCLFLVSSRACDHSCDTASCCFLTRKKHVPSWSIREISLPFRYIYSGAHVGRTGYNALSRTLTLRPFSLLPNLQKSLPVSGAWR